MKLFLTIFGAIIAASITLALLSVIIIMMSHDATPAVAIICVLAFGVGLPVLYDRILSRFGA